MSNFLAVSAFRTDDINRVMTAITEYCSEYGVVVVSVTGVETDPARDAQVYSAENGWICCLWPNYFNLYDFPLCTEIAKRLSIDISTVRVYEGDLWEHLFLSGDKRLHYFCSFPTYFEPEETECFDSSVPRDPVALCSHLGVAHDQVALYLQTFPLPEENAQNSNDSSLHGLSQTNRKAYAEDSFDIDNFWVFTDFWRKLGIVYPDPIDSYVAVLRFEDSFEGKLPMNG